MTLAQRPRWLRWPGGRRTTLRAEFETLALALLSGQGEASGVANAPWPNSSTGPTQRRRDGCTRPPSRGARS
jgi:hypothetical protein